jgi:rsbT co-antagonist protein RsbR
MATEPPSPSEPKALHPETTRRRIAFMNFSSDDAAKVRDVKAEVLDHLDEHMAAFFGYLEKFPEGRGLFSRPDLLAEARKLKREHLIAMIEGEYEGPYVQQRFRLGQIYNRAEIPTSLFVGAFNNLMNSILHRIVTTYATKPQFAFEHMAAFRKVAAFDLAIIVDAMMSDREETIRRQQEAIRELSTPTLKLRERLLILPIIGLLDSYRAKQLTEGLLHGIRDHRAKVVVMDLTGVATVDSKVANHLIQTVAAAGLMGAVVIVTGLSGAVAQSLVTLGVDLTSINTMGDLQGGIEEAERILLATTPFKNGAQKLDGEQERK